jgi:hypothetical protein
MEKSWDTGVITPELLNYNAQDEHCKAHCHYFSSQFFQSTEGGGRYVDKSPGELVPI